MGKWGSGEVGCGVWGVGCRVWGVGCGVWGVGCGENKAADRLLSPEYGYFFNCLTA
ncbi:hypothetical protein GQR42_19160 [Microcystis aeruginosa FD4]|uniref:Uncharacterized protein n=1 Tax=Microcystis aeruginosa FD4 TaxID=2686288 RepID=A0A857D602_MICAE|nr:hypothetical protein GQR42_19160 [Microcystis aeruginosa FD4]